jgi:ornithine carbamoyltransferase
VLSRYIDAIAVRVGEHALLEELARHSSVPVVNALTPLHHPCQALADLLTLQERFGRLAGLRVAYLGDGNNVAHSLIEACALTGIDIVVATPPGYEPDADITDAAAGIAASKGSLVLTTHDPYAAAAGADAVYTDVWVSMGDAPEEREARIAAFTPYRVDEAVLSAASPEAVFLHCLPAHRGEEVAASIIDGPRSVVFDQAENRLHTEQALLLALTGGGHELDPVRCPTPAAEPALVR